MSLEEGFGFVGFFWFVCCFVFLTHPYSTATLYPIHLISIFPQSASTVVSISHTPEKPQMIHISLWAGVYLQTCPVAQCTIPTHLQQNNSYPQWHFQFGETHDPSTEQVSDIAEVVHKSPFNSTSHLLETLTKKKGSEQSHVVTRTCLLKSQRLKGGGSELFLTKRHNSWQLLRCQNKALIVKLRQWMCSRGKGSHAACPWM